MQLKRLVFTIPLILLSLIRNGVDEKRMITLPYEIENSGIVIERQACYEGPFFENGIEEIAVNIAALVIKNESDKLLENVDLTVDCGGETYLFSCTLLPPGGRVLVPEKQKKRWNDGEISNIYGDFKLIKNDRSIYEVTEEDKCQLILRNNSEGDISMLEVCYKSYYAQDDLYLGGYTFKTCLYDLKAGETRRFAAHHYAAGYSKIVSIQSIGSN